MNSDTKMRGFGTHMLVDLSGGNGYQNKTDETNLVSLIWNVMVHFSENGLGTIMPKDGL